MFAKHNQKINRQIIPSVIAFLFIIYSASWLLYNAGNFGVTYDEVAYGPSGVRMLLRGDVITNNEHPPLNKILAGLFLLPTKPNIETALTKVPNNEQWQFGNIFLFESGNSTDYVMFISRLPTVLLTLLMIVSVWLWSKKNIGAYAGLGAATSLALNPNILANGALTTNDMHLTVAVWLLFVATFNLLSKPKNLPVYLWFGLALGFVLVAKFSGLFFVGLAVVIALAGLIIEKTSAKKLIVGIAIAIVTTLGLIWISYVAIEWRAVTSNEPITVDIPGYKSVEMTNPIKKILIVPLLRYREGYNMVSDHNKRGHNAYLDGQFSMEGFRNYFTKSLWYKTPTALLLFAALGFFMAIIKKKWILVTLFVIGTVTVVVANLSHIHIGIRHILPVYVLFAPSVGFAFSELIASRGKIPYSLAGLVILWWVTDLGLNGPNKMSYFSEISGGWQNGYKHLADSNTDWGQEFKYLTSYLDRHPDQNHIIGRSAGENPIYRGYKYTRLDSLGTNALCGGLKPDETLIVSVNLVIGLFGPYPCIIEQIDKADRLGHTYFIFKPDDFYSN